MSSYYLIAIVFIILVLLFTILIHNKLVKLRNAVREAFSTMDIYLKKRFDLIPNLVETVKGYASHESETLEKLVKARTMVQHAQTGQEKMEGEYVLSSTLRNLFAVVENYPDLKSNENFLELQEEMSRVESEIASSRKYYNGTVRLFNNSVEVFPNNLIAKLFGFESMPLFELDDVSERKNVKVHF